MAEQTLVGLCEICGEKHMRPPIGCYLKRDAYRIAELVIKHGKPFKETHVSDSRESGIWSDTWVGYRWGQMSVSRICGGLVIERRKDVWPPYWVSLSEEARPEQYNRIETKLQRLEVEFGLRGHGVEAYVQSRLD